MVDFTQKTDAEILAVLKQAAGGTCGRFRAEQLARPLLPLAVQGPSRWRAWLAAVVAVWGLREEIGAPAKAQAPVEQGPGATRQKMGKPVTAADTPAVVVVRGVVLDSATNSGLPGATVLLKGTRLGVGTDSVGHFELRIPAEQWQSTNGAVTISFVSYTSQDIVLGNTPIERHVRIVLGPSRTMLLGDMVITDYHKPWPWHPRRFYYWLTQPFRRR